MSHFAIKMIRISWTAYITLFSKLRLDDAPVPFLMATKHRKCSLQLVLVSLLALNKAAICMVLIYAVKVGLITSKLM